MLKPGGIIPGFFLYLINVMISVIKVLNYFFKVETMQSSERIFA